jgi:tripartite-type tricarboxylate transporter receptor subunit TctC
MMSRVLSRRALVQSGPAAAVLPWSNLACADSPPIKLLVGFSAGGGADAVARLMASAMQTVSNRTVLVENRAGAGGRIAIMAVKAAEPDGNTMFFGSTSVLTLFPHVFTGLTYSLDRDYTPVSTCCAFPYAIVVSPSIGVTDLQGLAAWARANPGKAFFGTPGVGTPQHLIGSLLGRRMGVRLDHIAFKSGAEATQQLLGGSLPIVLATPGQFYPMHRAGRVRMIATTGHERAASMKDVPTCAESGFPNLVFEDSFGFIAPAATGRATSEALVRTIDEAMQLPQVKKGLAAQDMQPLQIHGAAYAEYLRDENERWATTVKTVGFAPSAG